MASYGLFRGLNEAYNSYRDREREIEDKERRATEDVYRQEAAERAEQEATRERERYQYGVSRRAFEEKNQQIAQEASQLGLDQATDERKEWLNNKDFRVKTNKLNLQKLQQELKGAKVSYDMNKITLRAQKGAENYRAWKRQFMQGGTVEQLVQNFNSDKDPITGEKNAANDIKNVVGDEKNGWEVEFENGRVERFRNRDEVAEHLEFMADPDFHQNYLLQERKYQNDLSIALAEESATTPEDMLPFKKDWNAQTIKNTDRLYGQLLKEGMISFGEAGAKDVAASVRSIVDDIGAGSKWRLDLSNSTVAAEVGRMAESMLDLDPQALDKRATDVYERMSVEQLQELSGIELPDGKPDDDEPEYKDLMDHIKHRDVMQQVDQLRSSAYSAFFSYNPENGAHQLRENAGSKGDGSPGNEIAAPTRTDPAAQATEIATGDARDSYGVQEPAKADVGGRGRGTPGAAPAGVEKSDTTTDWVQEKKKALAVGGNPRSRKKTRKQEAAIRADFEKNWSSYDGRQKRAWLDEFGDKLTTTQKRLAEASLPKPKVPKRAGRGAPTSGENGVQLAAQ